MRDFRIFPPSSADEVVETKKNIGDIVEAQKNIETGLLSWLFAAIVCCSQHIEILTNSVSTSQGEMRDFRIFSPNSANDVVETKQGISDIVLAQKSIKKGRLSELFANTFCCSQDIEILTNAVSASQGEKRDFQIFRQVRPTTSLIRSKVSAILFQRKRLPKLTF